MAVEPKQAMPKPTIPPQITRLLMMTVMIVVAYFGARYFLVPESFGQYGWYRADALKDYQALPISFGGQAACADCHDEVVKKRAKAKHRSVSCETCHGPLQAHVEDATTVKPPKITDPKFCTRCHERAPARPEKFPQVVLADHNPGQKCVECHSPHLPTEAP